VSSSAFCVAMALSSAEAFDEDFFAAISEQVEKEMNAVVAPLPLLAKRSLSPPSTSASVKDFKKMKVDMQIAGAERKPPQQITAAARILLEAQYARTLAAEEEPLPENFVGPVLRQRRRWRKFVLAPNVRWPLQTGRDDYLDDVH
jgi:hypothetical protein